MTVDVSQSRTEVGNYFVSNYPPFSQWKPEFVSQALDALAQPPRVDDPLGLYIHIPFCRKRCLFCYFKVYTDKNSSEIEVYLDALIKRTNSTAAPRRFRDVNSVLPISVAVLLLTSATNNSTTSSTGSTGT